MVCSIPRPGTNLALAVVRRFRQPYLPPKRPMEPRQHASVLRTGEETTVAFRQTHGPRSYCFLHAMRRLARRGARPEGLDEKSLFREVTRWASKPARAALPEAILGETRKKRPGEKDVDVSERLFYNSAPSG